MTTSTCAGAPRPPDTASSVAEAVVGVQRDLAPTPRRGRLRGPHRRLPHKVDKAGAVYTLLVNARTAQVPWILIQLVLGTLLRTVAYLVGKVPGQAVDDNPRPAGTCCCARADPRGPPQTRSPPGRQGRAAPAPPPGARVRATVEQIAGNFMGGDDPDATTGAGRHGGAVESGPGGDDADFLQIEQFAGSSASPAIPARCSSWCCCSSPSWPAAACSAAAARRWRAAARARRRLRALVALRQQLAPR